ncbi:hypothetical protein LMG28688_06149 [Paraburkholderia caffeinitolerans]|uniref:Uncharacterized protein n=2 Tax=Paraburkholderia caffeinitolerans TaxID=1723730 RepID=A0A6J5GTJ0_9BURK|nr:hypothetical protein LMG28688_06149 [Paraburkholderia caffeinitolerans]
MNKKRFADAVDEDLKPFDSPSLESFEGVFDMLQDFSLTTADFLEWLKTTRNELRFIAKLDEVQLARVTGIATFFSVSQTNLDELKG